MTPYMSSLLIYLASLDVVKNSVSMMPFSKVAAVPQPSPLSPSPSSYANANDLFSVLDFTKQQLTIYIDGNIPL